MRPGRAMVAATLALAVLGGACASEAGDDDITGGTAGDDDRAAEAERQAYIDAIVDAAEEQDEDLTREQLTCVAESFVDGFGAAAIADAGVTPEDVASEEIEGPADLGLEFSDEQAASFYDRLTGCMDVRALVIEALVGEAGEVPGVAACLDERLTDDLLERVITIGYTEGEEGLEATPGLADEVEQAIGPCVAPGP
ncbi:MAG TPA: hypothetical protein VFZ77_02935 [Acidimicrobiales bacterium]